MAFVVNDAANVSTIKGKSGGYSFSIPRTAANLAKIDNDSWMDFTQNVYEIFADADNLGFCSNDGMSESESSTTETDTDHNGDPINTSRAERNETFTVTLHEMREAALKEAFGHGNVTVDQTTGAMKVRHNNAERNPRIYIFDYVLKPTEDFPNGRGFRKLIPNGQVTEVGERSYNSRNIFAAPLTISCNAYGTGGDTIIDAYEGASA